MIEKLAKQCVALVGVGRFKEALEVSRRVIDLRPSEALYFYNHYLIARELGLDEEAISALTEARDRMPNCPVIRILLSSLLLSKGRFREGFVEKEWRFHWPLPKSPCPTTPLVLEFLPKLRSSYRQPYWDGSPVAGKTILVFNEAGFGDLIQNIRYLPLLKERSGARIVLEVKPELYRLLRNCKGVDEFAICDREKRLQKFFKTYADQKDDDLPPHDYILSCESFHHFLNPDLANTPRKTPYIWPEENKHSEATTILSKYDGKFKVGVIWAGNKADPTDRNRSCRIKHFRHLANVDGVQLFSLQKGDLKRTWAALDGQPETTVDLAEGREECNLVELGDYITDFNDTANVIRSLNLVIAVDTSVVHLAGAIAAPAWVLLSKKNQDWRWQVSWYDTVRVFEQRTADDWEELLIRVAEEIKQRRA